MNANKFTEIKDIPKNISRVIPCERYTLILLDDGTLLGCGYNIFGWLGLGDTIDRNTFHEIKIGSKDIDDIFPGPFHIIIKCSDGRLLSCGLNDSGQLGQSDYNDRNVFEEIRGIPKNIIDVTCGSLHTTLLSDGNRMYGGYNRRG